MAGLSFTSTKSGHADFPSITTVQSTPFYFNNDTVTGVRVNVSETILDGTIKYYIGYSTSGKYSDSIIIPSYDASYKINYFISRKIINSNRKYNSPSCDKNALIGLESNINWKTPIILCEGIFDAIAIKRNAIPLFGKTISKALMVKLVESEVKTVYLALDQDAIKDSLDHAMTLLNYGKSVYLVEMEGKDPSELGFEKFTKLLHNAHELTLVDLMLKKINL